ncbi:hypothetical protein HYPSUDRAFT_71831 [Hypholoma sublateritium FD-334 SS-4]|uniref:GB1/RHD3-type G domain-containing protein n=1 Tax=Hypholoma sublateritium (strain FD-334 SS-4) TaxID=945553 RepID=A0A0D2P5T5_HYPSF|nr:hypothetical protein HYPSUDRAFT_71831 [Hypholoma sublateritium FD-334 SS-4]
MSGQWHGWRKWIHHVEGMKAVLFLVDLSRYDHDPEESSSNYIEDAIDMFDTVCNTGEFEGLSKIVFFDTDEFADKLTRAPLENYCPDYSGQTYDSVCDYFLNRFLSVNRSEYRSKMDMQQVKFMLSAVQDILLQIYLRELKLIT